MDGILFSCKYTQNDEIFRKMDRTEKYKVTQTQKDTGFLSFMDPSFEL